MKTPVWGGLPLLFAAACPASSPATSEAPRPSWGLEASPSQPAQWLGEAPAAVPQRVVTLAPGLTELTFALGAGDAVVATSRFADFPPEALDRPRVGGLTDLNVEAILAAGPDVVVGIFAEAYRSKLDTLVRAEVPVLLLPSSSIADFAESARVLGKLLDRRDEAAALVSRLAGDLASVSPAPGNRPPRVAVVYGWRPLFLAGPGSFPDELLHLLGASNVVSEGSAWTQWSYEAFAASRPDVLIDATSERGRIPAVLSHLPAARSGRIYPAPESLARPGPRLGAAAQALGRIFTSTASSFRAHP